VRSCNTITVVKCNAGRTMVYLQGLEFPCFVGCSESAGIISEMLATTLEQIDSQYVFDQSNSMCLINQTNKNLSCYSTVTSLVSNSFFEVHKQRAISMGSLFGCSMWNTPIASCRCNRMK
jgi:hypothetical protein